MRVQMRAQITGTRDGELWPGPGVEVDLPDEEGAALCASGHAVPAVSGPVVERATAPAGEERDAEVPARRKPGRPRKS